MHSLEPSPQKEQQEMTHPGHLCSQSTEIGILKAVTQYYFAKLNLLFLSLRGILNEESFSSSSHRRGWGQQSSQPAIRSLEQPLHQCPLSTPTVLRPEGLRGCSWGGAWQFWDRYAPDPTASLRSGCRIRSNPVWDYPFRRKLSVFSY